MAVSLQSKKEVAKAWLEEFPALSPLASNKFFQILGPIMIGFELIKSRWDEDYMPYYVIYPLWDSMKNNLRNPMLIGDFDLSRNFSLFQVRYTNPSAVRQGLSSEIRSQIPVSFGKDVAYEELANFLDNAYNKQSTIKVFGYNEPSYFELKFRLALFCSEGTSDIILSQLLKDSSKWDMPWFERVYKTSFMVWFDALKNTTRADFIAIIEENKMHKKLEKLQSFDLICKE